MHLPMHPKRLMTSAAVAVLVFSAGPLGAEGSGYHGDKRAQGKSYSQQQVQQWKAMRQEVVSANDVMGGEVTNGFNPVGQVRDLVLSSDRDEVKYVLYDVPFPYSFYGTDDGFAAYDKVDFEHGAVGGFDVRLENEEASQAPDELRLKRQQSDHRLVSNVLGESMTFANENASRTIEDILISRDDGEVKHYVVDMNPDSLFNPEPHAIPADQVSISDKGNIETDLQFKELDDMQPYETALLK